MTSAHLPRRATIALTVGVLSCGAPSPAPRTHPAPPAVDLPAPSAAAYTEAATAPAPSAEDRLDALIAEAWRQRGAGESAAALATFAHARALVPPGVAVDRAASFLALEAPDGVARVVARGDPIVMHGGSGPAEVSVLVDPASGDVVRWFGRARAFAAGRDRAVLLRASDPDKHTGALSWVDLRTGAESAPVVVWTGALGGGWRADAVVASNGQSVAFMTEDGSTSIHSVAAWSDAWSTGPGDTNKVDAPDPLELEAVDFSPDGKVAFVVPELMSSRGPQPQSATLVRVDADAIYSEEMPEPVDPFHPGRIPPSQTEPFHAFSPDSRFVLIEARKKGALELVDAATGSVLGSSRTCLNAQFVTFAADGRHVVLVAPETIARSSVCALEVPSLRVAARATWPGPPTWLVPLGTRMLADLIGAKAVLFDPATLKTVAIAPGHARMSGRQRALAERPCDPKAPRPAADCGGLFEVTPDGVRLLRTVPRDAPIQPEIAALPENAADRLCHAGRWVFPRDACGP